MFILHILPTLLCWSQVREEGPEPTSRITHTNADPPSASHSLAQYETVPRLQTLVTLSHQLPWRKQWSGQKGARMQWAQCFSLSCPPPCVFCCCMVLFHWMAWMFVLLSWGSSFLLCFSNWCHPHNLWSVGHSLPGPARQVTLRLRVFSINWPTDRWENILREHYPAWVHCREVPSLGKYSFKNRCGQGHWLSENSVIPTVQWH